MRLLITGVDGDGRSCAVSHDELDMPADAGPITVANLWATSVSPPPPRPAQSADFIDLGLAPGLIRWIAVAYEPGAETPKHHTDSLDTVVVVAGSITLELDDGPHELDHGDYVVMNGVDHKWIAGPEGCHLSVASIGTPPVDP